MSVELVVRYEVGGRGGRAEGGADEVGDDRGEGRVVGFWGREEGGLGLGFGVGGGSGGRGHGMRRDGMGWDGKERDERGKESLSSVDHHHRR